jgi:hypothetical protein
MEQEAGYRRFGQQQKRAAHVILGPLRSLNGARAWHDPPVRARELPRDRTGLNSLLYDDGI